MKITLKFVQIQFQRGKTLQKGANQVGLLVPIHVPRKFWHSKTQKLGLGYFWQSCIESNFPSAVKISS